MEGAGRTLAGMSQRAVAIAAAVAVVAIGYGGTLMYLASRAVAGGTLVAPALVFSGLLAFGLGSILFTPRRRRR